MRAMTYTSTLETSLESENDRRKPISHLVHPSLAAWRFQEI